MSPLKLPPLLVALLVIPFASSLAASKDFSYTTKMVGDTQVITDNKSPWFYTNDPSDLVHPFTIPSVRTIPLSNNSDLTAHLNISSNLDIPFIEIEFSDDILKDIDSVQVAYTLYGEANKGSQDFTAEWPVKGDTTITVLPPASKALIKRILNSDKMDVTITFASGKKLEESFTVKGLGSFVNKTKAHTKSNLVYDYTRSLAFAPIYMIFTGIVSFLVYRSHKATPASLCFMPLIFFVTIYGFGFSALGSINIASLVMHTMLLCLGVWIGTLLFKNDTSHVYEQKELIKIKKPRLLFGVTLTLLAAQFISICLGLDEGMTKNMLVAEILMSWISIFFIGVLAGRFYYFKFTAKPTKKKR